MTTLYGSNVANGVLTSASSMSTTTGGTETSALTSHTGSNQNGEIWSQGNASLATVATIPTTPTGNGWVFAPGAGSYAAGTWGIAITVSSAFQMSTVVAVLSKYSGGSYTSIGTGTITITSASKTAYSLTTSSLGGVTFAAGDLLHIGLWGTVTSGNMSGMNPVVYESSSATAGVAGDMAFTPPAFTPALTTTPMNSEDDLTVGDVAGWQESALASEGLTGAGAAVWQMGVLFAEGLSIGESISASAGIAAITYLDSFAGRTVSNGWGTASDGINSWTIQSGTAANFAVTSGEGTITSVGFLSIGTTQADGEILVRFQIPDASSRVEIRLRYANSTNYYVLYLQPGNSRIFKMVAGTFTNLNVSGLSTAVAGQFWWGRFQVQGTTLRASLWKDGNVEPAFFQTSTIESSLPSGLPILYGSGLSTSVLSYDHFSFTTALTIPLIASDLLSTTETALTTRIFSPSDLLSGASSARWQGTGLFTYEEDLSPTETCLVGRSPLFEEDLLPTETAMGGEIFSSSEVLSGVSSPLWQEGYLSEEDLTPGTSIATLSLLLWNPTAALTISAMTRSSGGFLPSDLLTGVSVLSWQETTFFAFEEDLTPGTGIFALPVSPWDLFALEGLLPSDITLFDQSPLFEEDLTGLSTPVWLPIDAPNFVSEDDLTLTEQALFDQPALLEDDLLVGDLPGWQSWPIEALSITDSCTITGASPANWQRSLNLTVTSGIFMQRGVSWLEGLAGVDQLIGGAVSILPIIDSFFRPDQNGWGTASDGRDTWTHPIVNSVIGGIPDSFIAVNRGRVSNSGENVLLCGGSVGAENDVLVLASFTDPLLSGIGAVARSLSDGTIGYQAIVLGGSLGFYSRLDEPYTGSPQGLLASLPIALTAGSLYWIHFRVTGAVTPLLQANVWQDGTPEPANWMLSFTDTLGTPIFGADQVGVYLCTPDADFVYAFQGQQASLKSLPMQAEEDLLAGEALVATATFSKTHSLSVRESAILASLSTAGIPPGTWEEDLIAGEALLAEGAVIFLPAALAISSQAVVRKIFPATAVEALTGSSSLLATNTEQRTIPLSLAESALCYSHAAINPSLVTTPFVFAPDVIPVAESMVAQVGTPLTLYLSSTTSATTSAADQIYTISGSPTTAFDYIQIGTATAWGEFLSGGNAGAWPGLTGIGLPSTQGWFLDGHLLENQQLILGLWSATLIMQAWRGTATTGSAAGTLTVDLHIRAWKYNSQVATFELLDDLAFLGASITSSLTSFTFPFLADTTEPFITGERLYLEIWGRIATNSNAASNQMIRLANLSTDSAGKTGSPSASITTPGFAPLTVAPSTWGLGIYGVSTFTAVPLTWAPSALLTVMENSAILQGEVVSETLSAQSGLLLAGTVSAQEALSPGETFLATIGDLLNVLPLAGTETFFQTGASLTSEQLAASSTPLFGENAFQLETLSLNEGLTGTLSGLSSELLTCLDQMGETVGVTLSEAAMVGSSVVIGEGVLFGEVLSIGESLAAASILLGVSVTAFPCEEDLSLADGGIWGLLSAFSEGGSGSSRALFTEAETSGEALSSTSQGGWIALSVFSEGILGSSGALFTEAASFGEALSLTETIAGVSIGSATNYIDSFAGRTTSNGWGTASDGVSSWTLVSGTAANFAVAGGEGTATSAGGCSIGTTQTNGEILVRFQIPDASSRVEIRLRYTNDTNYYTLYLQPGNSRIFKMVAGTFTNLNVSGLSTAVAGQFWWARFRIQGTTLRASLWKDGNVEPALWQTSVVEASLPSGLPVLYGSGLSTSVMSFDHFTFTLAATAPMNTAESLIGASSFSCSCSELSSEALSLTESLSVIPILFAAFLEPLVGTASSSRSAGYQNFLVPTAAPPPMSGQLTVANDTFLRANQSGWGTASDRVDTWAPIGGGPAYSINANQGLISTTAGSYASILGTGWLQAGEIRIRFTPSSSGDYCGLTFGYRDGSNFCYTEVVNGAARIYKIVGGSSTLLTPSGAVSISGGTTYWQHLSISGTTARLRIWVDGTAEPSTWQVTVTDTVIGLSGQYGVHGYLNGSGDTIAYDSLSILTTATTYYVDGAAGSDSNPGTAAQPFLTLTQAQRIMGAGSSVLVQPGVYDVGTGFTTLPGGTSSAGILYQSLQRFGAQITTSNSPLQVWLNQGDHVTISGFEVTSTDQTTRVGIDNNASFCLVQSCDVHDIAAIGTSNGGGGIVHGNNTGIQNDTRGCLTYRCGNPSGNSGLDQAPSTHGIYYHSLYGTISDNISWGNGGKGINLDHSTTNVTIVNNLVFQNWGGGIYISAIAPLVNDYTMVANNIVIFNGNANPNYYQTGAIYEPPGVTGVHNQYLNNCISGNYGYVPTGAQITLQNGLIAQNTILSDPLLVNYQPDGSGDYHLASGSPCIGAGAGIGLDLSDYSGYPMKNPPDIGPYERFPLTLAVGNTVLDVPGWQSWPVEALSIAETPLTMEAAFFTEPLSVSDLFVRMLPMTSEDDLSPSSQLLGGRQSTPVEGNSLLETFLQGTGWIPLEAPSIGESGSWQSLMQGTDALTASSNVLIGESALRLEPLSVSDVPLGGLAVSWADILGIASAQASTASLIPKEGLSGVESLLLLGSAIWGEVLSLSDSAGIFPSPPALAIFVESLLASSALRRQEGVLLLDPLSAQDTSLILSIGGLKITVHVRDGTIIATVRNGRVTAKVRDGTIQTTVR